MLSSCWSSSAHLCLFLFIFEIHVCLVAGDSGLDENGNSTNIDRHRCFDGKYALFCSFSFLLLSCYVFYFMCCVCLDSLRKKRASYTSYLVQIT